MPLTKLTSYIASVVLGFWNRKTSSVLMTRSARCWELCFAGYQLLPSQEEVSFILMSCGFSFSLSFSLSFLSVIFVVIFLYDGVGGLQKNIMSELVVEISSFNTEACMCWMPSKWHGHWLYFISLAGCWKSVALGALFSPTQTG